MKIHVEFYGIPRERTGVASTDVEILRNTLRLEDVLIELEHQFPRLAHECINNGRLSAGYIANLDGKQFINDTKMTLRENQVLLIMSSDAGG